MNRFLTILPRPVLISVCVIVGTLIAFGIASVVLGGGRDDALIQNAQLNAEIQKANTALKQSVTDQQYVKDNTERYEALLKSDRLVAHTRRAAVVALQSAAEQYGLGVLNYTFNAASSTSQRAVTTQPKSGAYAVAVEEISLKVGAPIDGQVYRFLIGLPDAFPGVVILDGFTLSRPPVIDALRGKGDITSVVTGEATFTWRTAQAAQQPGAAK